MAERDTLPNSIPVSGLDVAKRRDVDVLNANTGRQRACRLDEPSWGHQITVRPMSKKGKRHFGVTPP